MYQGERGDLRVIINLLASIFLNFEKIDTAREKYRK